MDTKVATVAAMAASAFAVAAIAIDDTPGRSQCGEIAVVSEALERELPAIAQAGGGQKTRATLAVIDYFLDWIREDIARGYTNRAELAAQELAEIGHAELERIARVKAGLEWDAPSPHYVTSQIEISHAQIIANREWPDGHRDRGDVILTGFGHFDMVRADIEKLPALGCHVIQIEVGPSYVLTSNRVSMVRIEQYREALDRAEKANVQVCILLSPHYYPKWALEKLPSDSRCSSGFFHYCVHSPQARAFLEKYLRVLVPAFAGHRALHSFCISNEPEWSACRCPHLVRGWPKWLEDRYGSVEALNAAWGTAYASFSDVPAARDAHKVGINDPTRETLEYYRYNREKFAEFHDWIAGIVRELAPGVPVHAKIRAAEALCHEPVYASVDLEQFSALGEWHGGDYHDYYKPTNGWSHAWAKTEAALDFQRSCADKPIFDSEAHILPDKGTNSVPASHIYTALWQGVLHGKSAAAIWTWDRYFGEKYKEILQGLFLDRPSALAAAAYAALDLNRLADRLAPLQNLDPTVLLHWSDTSLCLDGVRGDAFLECYRAASSLGQPLGVATERMLADYGRCAAREWPMSEVRAILLPNAAHIPADVRKGLDRLAAEGVAIVEVPEKSDRELAADFAAQSREWGLPDFPRVMAPDSDAGVFGVESRGCVVDGKALVSLVNHTDKAQRVRLPAPGRDLITGASVPLEFNFPPLMPMLVELAR